MTITYSIAPNPHWVVIDDFSKLPVGAAIYTYSSQNPSVYKPAYQNASNTDPFPQPIVGFANGTFPPIFWQFDDANPNDLYYIRVYDKVNDPGNNANFLWDFNGLTGSGTGGGGGGGTISNDIDNLVVNGEFYRNIGNVVGSPSIPLITTIAPSNNAGLAVDSFSANINGPASPDIIFAKSNTTSHDNITFTNFPNGASDLAPNPTPQFFVNYTSDNSGSESYKYFQFPLVKGVQNLSGQTVGIQIFARNNGGNSNVSLSIRQFFGNGPGATGDVLTPVGLLNFGAGWTKTLFSSFVIPSISGASTIGACGNDGTFLQLAFPLSVACNIDFILPSVYLGGVPSAVDFHSLDFVDAIVNSPRTGDIRTSLNSFLPGWVLMNDGTIGDASSNATSRNNIDTFPLFNLLWQTFNGNQALAPMYTSGGTPTAYGLSSTIDFANNHNQIALTRNAGRVMAGAVPTAISQAFTNVGNVMTVTSTASFITGSQVLVSGGGLPTPLVANTNYYAIVLSNTTMSLATTYANALSNTVLPLTSNAAGTVTAFPQHLLGSFLGEEQHLQSIAELAPHNHTYNITNAAGVLYQGGVPYGNGTSTTSNTGGGLPFNVMQPTVYMNVLIKL